MSCHKLGPVHQAVRPSHLNHLPLRRWSELSAVSVLTGKKQTKFKETWKKDKYLMQPDRKYGSVSCSHARVKCEALNDVWITYNQELLSKMTVLVKGGFKASTGGWTSAGSSCENIPNIEPVKPLLSAAEKLTLWIIQGVDVHLHVWTNVCWKKANTQSASYSRPRTSFSLTSGCCSTGQPGGCPASSSSSSWPHHCITTFLNLRVFLR